MENRKSRFHLGIIGWTGLFGWVIAYDAIAIATGVPTLSATFHRISTLRWWRIGLVAFWFYLTGHLFRWIPDRYDLFRRFFDRPANTV